MRTLNYPLVLLDTSLLFNMADTAQRFNLQSSTNSSTHSSFIEDVLASQGLLTSQQLDFIKNEAKRRQESTEKILSQMGWVNEEQLVAAKGKIIGVPYVDPAQQPISPEVLAYLPEEVARRFTVIPIAREKDTIAVAMVDPLDLQVLEFIEKKSGLAVRPYIATSQSIQRAVAEQYSRGLSFEVGEALKEAAPGLTAPLTIQTEVSGILGEAPVARIVSTLLEYGIKVRASDIHIEPLENETRIRYRIDGILHEKLILPRRIHDAIVSRIKILGNMKIDEKRLPQDARFNFKIGQEDLDLRLSTMPTAYGEKVVMRLLKKTGGVPSLPELGLRGIAIKHLEENIARPHGIILVCGPTGSGKTTTLYAILSKLNSTKVNIMTLEDPIEYQIAGVNQVQVNLQAGLTFASGLRSFLRQDPNIIMVGEIRDTETTELAIQAALTGHLVFSTLHTNDAAGALPRLLDMQAEPYLIASTVTCVVGQRVVRRICSACRYPKPPTEEILAGIKKDLEGIYKFEKGKQVTFYAGKGCRECNNTGYLGRIGIFEVLVVSEKVSRMVLSHEPAMVIASQAISEGMIAMKQDGFLKVIEGVTTIEEVLRVAEE
ncbi:MAG: General secretory pathway protein E [Candidatus Curtissbacteria bacterium GW2011_GWA1_40_47]|nr:MAG: General secretory pathway protein E [Microgenomates group bacterium GW2011_GWC1_40_35]KKR66162.1 MAG: General secretory pathway protein E [Candidatus Curtissbacteria bacterium GW2011_GWA1_40_47]